MTTPNYDEMRNVLLHIRPSVSMVGGGWRNLTTDGLRERESPLGAWRPDFQTTIAPLSWMVFDSGDWYNFHKITLYSGLVIHKGNSVHSLLPQPSIRHSPATRQACRG